MVAKKIRVLIVDDSSVIRTLLSKLLAEDPLIEVVGTASDPFIAREKLVALQPDVMTLDIEMPRMDGVSFLALVMEHFPTRTVIISSLASRGSEMALRALELGAVDIIEKPSLDVARSIAESAEDLIYRVKAAAQARIQVRSSEAKPSVKRGGPSASQSGAMLKTTHQIIAVAASTGGTEALKVFLRELPADTPGIVIVQHMPPVFTQTFAKHLADICPFEVKEAAHGDRVGPGRALLAPGNFHMELRRSGAVYFVELHQGPQLHNVRPAADHLLTSVAKYAGSNAIGIVLTGMGHDGAEGLLAMKKQGAFTIAQNEETCVVFGMPKTAIEIGAVDRVLPLDEIASVVMSRFKYHAA